MKISYEVEKSVKSAISCTQGKGCFTQCYFNSDCGSDLGC